MGLYLIDQVGYVPFIVLSMIGPGNIKPTGVLTSLPSINMLGVNTVLRFTDDLIAPANCGRCSSRLVVDRLVKHLSVSIRVTLNRST